MPTPDDLARGDTIAWRHRPAGRCPRECDVQVPVPPLRQQLIPTALASFVGRERELAELQALLASHRYAPVCHVASCGNMGGASRFSRLRRLISGAEPPKLRLQLRDPRVRIVRHPVHPGPTAPLRDGASIARSPGQLM